jgi:hypothetical protein
MNNMTHIRLRMKLDKGKRGVALEKLQNIVAETTKFLFSISEDLKLDASAKWVGTDFRNQSLSYNVEYPLSVPHDKQVQFNAAVEGLIRKERVQFLRPATAMKFYGIAKPLEEKEKMAIGVFLNGPNRAKWFKITHDLSKVSLAKSATKAEYIGAAQGTVHSWFKEADEPHFQLRETQSGALIKCYYDDQHYAMVASAVQMRNQIVHVHGMVKADLLDNVIEEIRIDNLLTPRKFTVSDYMSFVHPTQQ